MLLENNNEINLLTKKNKVFKTLLEVCHIHSTNRDLRQATERYKKCVVVLNARFELNQL